MGTHEVNSGQGRTEDQPYLVTQKYVQVGFGKCTKVICVSLTVSFITHSNANLHL